MEITLKDGSVISAEQGTTALDIAGKLSQKLKKSAVAAKVDGKLTDLTAPLTKDCALEILTFADEDGRWTLRHTASHVLAEAVKALYPQAKLAIGPAIENGFYYDFDVDHTFSPEELRKIEKEMSRIIAKNAPMERFELPREEAIAFMEERNEPYKVELIRDLPEGETISFYRQGDFVDLCAGAHLPSTGGVKAFKLTSTAGAYWRGNEKNKMLKRIYGTAFDSKAALEEYLEQLKEAQARDHNKLGRELGFFTTSPVVGQGLPLIMPKGAKAIQILQRFIEDEEERRGYQMTKTPLMAKSDLYKISGHWDHYKDGMFVLGDEEKGDEVMALRPMTCPFQYMIYKASHHSYRDLPVRYNETATEFRNEASGEMHGLIRIRQFTLSDAHIICTPEQVEQEFRGVVDLIDYVMKCIGIQDDVTYRFSKWDPNNKEKYIDMPEEWERTQDIMRNILNHIGLKFVEADNEAAFYGPKLDVQFKNVFGKEDTLFTVQIDFALAERFEMFYIDSDNQKKTPYIIHRSSIGCYERTLAMLIEKYAGALPLWISPEQVRLMTVTDKAIPYAEAQAEKLRAMGIRAKVDSRQEKIGYKIREARNERIPYMLTVGEKEIEDNTFSVRKRGQGDIGSIPVEDFCATVVKENAEKAIWLFFEGNFRKTRRGLCLALL